MSYRGCDKRLKGMGTMLEPSGEEVKLFSVNP